MFLSYSLHRPLFLIKYCHLISIKDIKSYLNTCFPFVCDVTNARFSYNISIYFQSVWRSLNFRDAVCSLRIYLSNVSRAIEYSARHSSLSAFDVQTPRSIIQESSHCRSHRRRRRATRCSSKNRARARDNFVVIGENRRTVIQSVSRRRSSCPSRLRFFALGRKTRATSPSPVFPAEKKAPK